MNEETFLDTFQPTIDYYGATVTPEILQVYFEELGGMTVADLDKALRSHMRTYKSFPKIAHLKPTKRPDELGGSRSYTDSHPEYKRTLRACEQILRPHLNTCTEGKFYIDFAFTLPGPDETFPVDPRAIVEKAMEIGGNNARLCASALQQIFPHEWKAELAT